MTARTVRLLHTSDVHLGGGFRPPDHGDHLDDCLCPLVAIEEAVADNNPDVVLVVGDLFDHQRVDDRLVATVLGRLGGLGVPCVVIAGNHDLHDHNSLYEPGRWNGPLDHLVFLDEADGTGVTLLDGSLSVWGKAMAIHQRDFRPLANAPRRPSDSPWHVVLGHGHHEPVDDDTGGAAAGFGLIGRSSPMTPDEIAATDADYVALGHWHVRTDVSAGSVPAWYSGAPYGVAATGTFNLVDLIPGQPASVAHIDVVLAATGCR